VENVNDIDSLVSITGCEISYLPLNFLGFPLGASFKAKSNWDDIIEKIERHLAGWKRMFFSKAGSITLINLYEFSTLHLV
jgi:hypothetical protein